MPISRSLAHWHAVPKTSNWRSMPWLAPMRSTALPGSLTCRSARPNRFAVAVKLTDPNSDVDTEYADKLQALVDALAKQPK